MRLQRSIKIWSRRNTTLCSQKSQRRPVQFMQITAGLFPGHIHYTWNRPYCIRMTVYLTGRAHSTAFVFLHMTNKQMKPTQICWRYLHWRYYSDKWNWSNNRRSHLVWLLIFLVQRHIHKLLTYKLDLLKHFWKRTYTTILYSDKV